MKSTKRLATNIPTQERLTEDLEMYDVNNDGKIDKTELVYYMKNTIFAKPDTKGGDHQ
jgi:Ca2+-binding EF-hand superfamily protein